MAQSKRWVFTHNNPTMEDHYTHTHGLSAVKGNIKYEQGESGTYHIQGWCSFASNKRLGAVKELCHGCHWEPMKGTEEQADKYVRKDDTAVSDVYPWGDPPCATGKGARNDLEDALAAFQRSPKEAATEHAGAMIRYHKGIAFVAGLLEVKWVPKPLTDLRPWQEDVCVHLNDNPNDRTIIWVTDSEGGRGKSALARHLVCTQGALILEGKLADMAYAYNSERIVCFDITRAQAEVSDHLYSFAEKLKNGSVMSTKYESKLKLFQPPHVIFFANKEPPAGVWSKDRIVHFDLDRE